MRIACAFAPSMSTPEHVVLAEQLGYSRAWLYDSPALYHDVWMLLAESARRTSTIGLGPGVLIPSLRHPMANAAAIATLADLAPGRVVVGIGAGFTGRYTLGHKPLRWSFVESYVEALRGLLRGETVGWEGRPIRMLHGDGFGATRPVDVPILIGADGPKGLAVAARVGDGTLSAAIPNAAPGDSHKVLLQFGTVLDEGEDVRSPRVTAAAGHAVAVVFHGSYERGGAAAVAGFPGGAAWVEAIEQIPADERHLTTHAGHLVRLLPFEEEAALAAADLIPAFTFSGTPDALRAKLDGFAAAGIDEIAYQPAGDIPTELRRMAAALGL